MLNQNNIIKSMSSKGNCYDKAPTESFFSTLTREMVYRENFKQEMKQSRNYLSTSKYFITEIGDILLKGIYSRWILKTKHIFN